MGYKQTYEKICKIKVPKGYEIHHIDMDRSNNDIMNLVMLPKKLHNCYHSKLEKIQNLHYKIQTSLQSSIEPGSRINHYILCEDIEKIKDFILVWYECVKYVDYRNYLLGIIPMDINNIGGQIYGDNKSK